MQVVVSCRYYERLGLPMLLLFLSKDGDDPITLPTKTERDARYGAEGHCDRDNEARIPTRPGPSVHVGIHLPVII